MRCSRLFPAMALLAVAPLLCAIAQDSRSTVTDAPGAANDRLRTGELKRYALLADRDRHTLQSAREYDVTFYRLRVRMLKGDPVFSGSAEVDLTSLAPGLTTLEFNAGTNLTIDSVLASDGSRLTFTHTAAVLSVTPAAALAQGARTRVRIYYSSPYQGSAIDVTQVQNADLGVPTVSIASQAEPYDARLWWPCKDDPSDKADSVEVIVTTDADLYPVSNGLVSFTQGHPDNTHTVGWISRYPIATYLVSVAIANYTVRNYTFNYGGNAMPVTNWFYSWSSVDMEPNATTMLDALNVLSDLFIPYPFMNEKYGMAEYEWGGSMEHQTVTSMGFYNEDVTVHELAHQWFGDKVTCATFEHIWLNEGWATYCEALYHEEKAGPAALRAKMATTAFYGPGKIFVDDPESKPMSVIFSSSLTYNKSSWVVHMLRGIVGDSAFFRATRRYLGSTARAQYRPVTTDEYRAFYEQESGMDLRPFFNEWINGEYYPTYQFSWTAADTTGGVVVNADINQLMVPQRQIFVMPIRLRFTFPSGADTTITVQNNTDAARYRFVFAERPASALLDPDNWILKKVVQPITNATFSDGILLVNGVDWDVAAYTADVKSAYQDSIFTGTRPFTFWDVFPNPAAGYPSAITNVKGSGPVPADLIGRYCTVVWIGNAYNGDEEAWADSPIQEYLRAGGNVVLITRLGRDFLTSEMLQQLGTSWSAGPQVTINECKADVPFLNDIRLTGDQSLIAPFATGLLRSENELLYSETRSFPQRQGLGVWGKPVQNGENTSGHLIYLALRPYRVNHADMKAAMQTVLDRLPCSPSAVASPATPVQSELAQSYPNPVASASAIIPFTIAGNAPRHVVVRVHDALGRLVRTLVDGVHTPGSHTVQFSTAGLPAGLYTYSLLVDGAVSTRTMILVQ